jgi:hypothetical protein
MYILLIKCETVGRKSEIFFGSVGSLNDKKAIGLILGYWIILSVT